MATQSIACSACGATVPYGRLSCPACGELLASVAGAARRNGATKAVRGKKAAAAAGPAREAKPETRPPAEPAPRTAAPAEVAAAADADWHQRLAAAAAPLAPSAPAAADAAAAPAAAGAPVADALPSVLHEPEPSDGTTPSWRAGYLEADEDDDPVVERPTGPPVAAWAAPAFAATSSTMTAGGAMALPIPGTAKPAAAVAAGTPTPGAYVPPVVHPAGPAAPARAWAGHQDVTDEAGTSNAEAARPAATGVLDPDRVRESVRWLAIGGAAIAAAGFILPWATSVIGASGLGYFDRWGLAGPLHLFILLGLLAVIGLSVVANPVPAWIRVGLLGLGLGALTFGLTWPYLFAPGLAPEVGLYCVAAGSLLLAIAGLAALVGDRHDGGRQGV
jgi:hypothetical protein